MPKTKLARIDLRMTPEEKENLKRKATEAHMTVSKYIIHLSQTKRVILKEDIAKLTVEISRIGNNINQIAYIGNYQKFVNRTQLKVIGTSATNRRSAKKNSQGNVQRRGSYAYYT